MRVVVARERVGDLSARFFYQTAESHLQLLYGRLFYFENGATNAPYRVLHDCELFA